MTAMATTKTTAATTKSRSCTTTTTDDDCYPYCCNVEIDFGSSSGGGATRKNWAVDLQKILSVDEEVGVRIIKTMHVVDVCETSDRNATTLLVVQFRATELKMLRVAVSSFAEYLQVALKCYYEFDSSS